MASAIVSPHLHLIPRDVAREQGMRKHYTGVACKNGHFSERYTRGNECAACALARYDRLMSNESSAELLRERWRQAEKKKCLKPEYNKLKCKRYYEANKEKENARSRAYKKAYRSSGYAAKLRPEQHQRYLEQMRRYKRTPGAIEKRREWEKRLDVKLARQARTMLKRTLRAAGSEKRGGKTVEILGYTFDQLKDHIERQFTRGMTWEKMGSEIHIDHIIPVHELVRRGITTPSEINALTNLRPMWADDNLRKGRQVTSLL